MRTRRGSGILLHPTSLPSPFGIGDFGPTAYRFVDLLNTAKQKFWQILPLGPPAKGNSPYSSLSAFAGNPLLISPEKLVQHGYLLDVDIAHPSSFCSSRIDFPRVRAYKEALLLRAYANFKATPEFRSFEAQNEPWLESFAKFMAWKMDSGGACWTRIDAPTEVSQDEIAFHKFVQYEFFRQWLELKQHCHDRDISIIGDLPFYVEHDSADVYSHREIFNLNQFGEPTVVGGVPPDYFSETGQLWGNPTYRWEKLRETGYQWWIDRLRASLALFDIVRLDHFRGFEASWEIQSGALTAVDGRWVQGPGADLFEAATRELGELPFIAENLGMITSQVEDLRRRFSFPGMAVMQFGFGPDFAHRPHTFSKDTVAYTGTHDNDTVVGWWRSRSNNCDLPNAAEGRAERERVEAYIGTNGQEINWAFIRAVMTSVANIAIFPLQDILGLGSETRMNTPGLADGNWCWRCDEDAITTKAIDRLRLITELTDRC